MEQDIEAILGALPQEHPYPDGDVTLILGLDGPSSKTIRVSSAIISHVSPVLKGLVATVSTNADMDGPRTISLPEDNVAAMIVLCHSIHLTDIAEIKLPMDFLGELAKLDQKYDCAAALSPWSRLWLGHWDALTWREDPYSTESYDHRDRCWALLRLAYAFDDQFSFHKYSQQLVLHCHSSKWLSDTESKQSCTCIESMPRVVKRMLLMSGLSKCLCSIDAMIREY